MTEAEWLACEDAKAMVRYLIGTDATRVQDVDAFPDCRTSDRKLRLFACACYHHVRHVLPHQAGAEAIASAEEFADGMASEKDRQRAESQLRALNDAIEGQWRASRGAERLALQPTYAAFSLGLQALWREAPKAAYYAPYTAQFHFSHIENPNAKDDPLYGGIGKAEGCAQCALIRDIFGNPFRPVAFSPSWRTDTAVTLARQMYDSRDFGATPILADAIQDAGCDNDDVLNHCRDATAPHVRGCWVVDLVLGKE